MEIRTDNSTVIAALEAKVAELEKGRDVHALFIERFKKAVFHFNKTHGDMNPLLSLAVALPKITLEAHNLEQQANALSDYAYSNEPLTKRGLNIKAIALRDQAKALKESE